MLGRSLALSRSVTLLHSPMLVHGICVRVVYVHAWLCLLCYDMQRQGGAVSKCHRHSVMVDLLEFLAFLDSYHINLPLSHIYSPGRTVTHPSSLLCHDRWPANCLPQFLKCSLETLLRVWGFFRGGRCCWRCSDDVSLVLLRVVAWLLTLPSLNSHPFPSFLFSGPSLLWVTNILEDKGGKHV